MQSLIQAHQHLQGLMILSLTLLNHRVDWESVFDQIQQQHSKATVGVFYCGPPVLGNLLKKLSAAHSGSTRFAFHRESF